MDRHSVIETMFSYLFAPNSPIIFDALGEFKDYLVKNLLFDAKTISASDNKVEGLLKSKNVTFVNDANLQSIKFGGKSADCPAINRISSQNYNGIDFKEDNDIIPSE